MQRKTAEEDDDDDDDVTAAMWGRSLPHHVTDSWTPLGLLVWVQSFSFLTGTSLPLTMLPLTTHPISSSSWLVIAATEGPLKSSTSQDLLKGSTSEVPHQTVNFCLFPFKCDCCFFVVVCSGFGKAKGKRPEWTSGCEKRFRM